jgi:hypothetical protein
MSVSSFAVAGRAGLSVLSAAMSHSFSRGARAARSLAWLVPILLPAGLAVAQTGADLLIQPFKPGTEVEVRGDAVFLETGDIGNGGADLGLSMFESRGRLRERRDDFIPRFGYDVFGMGIDSDNPVLPERLVDASVAAGIGLPNLGGFLGGMTIGLGYAGDTPFGDGAAWYGKATIAFAKKLGPDSDIGIGLDYDGNRTIYPDIPLPGFAYRRRVHQTAIVVLGVPVTSIEWKPDDRLSLEFRYLLVDTFEARLGYRLAGNLNVFGSFERRREAFELDELQGGDSHDRLLFVQRRVELGLRWEPREDVSLLAAGGYAFGQEFSTGFDFRDTDEVAEPSDEPYVRVGFEARF